MISPAVSGSQNAIAVCAALAVFAAAVVIGAVIGREGDRFPASDACVGLGAAGTAITLIGIAIPQSLSMGAAGAGLLALGCGFWLLWTGRRCGGPGQWLAVLPLIPLLFIIAGEAPSHWDEFSHWLSAAAFLYRYDGFPNPALPPIASISPGYPYAVPLFIHWASLLANRFLPGAGALFSALLLASCVGVFIGLVGEIARCGSLRPSSLSRTTICILVGVFLPAVTVLSPIYDPSFTLTALADTATAVATATCAALIWLILDRLARDRHAEVQSLALRFGFAASFLINLKQANGVLVALLLSAFLLIALRNVRLRAGAVLCLAPALLGPAMITTAAWNAYVTVNLPGGQFGILPPSQWNIDLLPEIVTAIGRQMAAHPVHFALMLAMSAAGIASLFRMRTGIDRLLGVTTVLWLGYTGFLLVTYVIVFSPEEAAAAAQFWRYDTHVGLVGLLAGVGVLARYWPSRIVPRPLAAVALLGMGALPVASVLFPSWIKPTSDPELPFYLEIGRDLADILPSSARLAVFDPNSVGLISHVVRYELARPGRDDRDLRVVWQVDLWDNYPDRELPRVAASFNNPSLSHILIVDPTPDYAQALVIEPKRGAFLLMRGEGAWQTFYSWFRSPPMD
jgi:hypothetical protein